MKKTIATGVLVAAAFAPVSAESIYDFTVKDRKGNDVSLADYKGKVVLIVNTATRCGFTPQYTELENIYEKYKDQGLIFSTPLAISLASRLPERTRRFMSSAP